jgi:UDP-N-acetylmuramoyl-tripeptide--D-alanyl-D-alanine ligase
MKPTTASQLAEVLGVRVAAGDPSAIVSAGVSTDTRRLVPGAAFFALRGDHFDGDRFAADAFTAGATVVVVSSWSGPVPSGSVAVIVVADPLLALQRLAFWWRSQLHLPVVGITGSNGKTSTKDFVAAVLGQRYEVAATRGNLNNHIGLPLSVLATSHEHSAAVWEMGMNHAGELAPLCEIARPKYGIITNIGTAHIEFLGSREAIAEEKGMLARVLPADGALALSAGCDFFEYFRQRTHAPVIPVGNGRGIVRAEGIVTQGACSRFTLVIDGSKPAIVELPVPGRHMVFNSLLAAAIGWKLGLDTLQIAEGLSNATITGGRLRCYGIDGIHIIDDTYNANPESMLAAIDTLTETPLPQPGGRRILVLGRMGELGDHAPAAHLRVGREAAAKGLSVIAVGEGAEGIAEGAGGSPHLVDPDEAAAYVARESRKGDVILFKGCRAAAVENVMRKAFPIR